MIFRYFKRLSILNVYSPRHSSSQSFVETSVTSSSDLDSSVDVHLHKLARPKNVRTSLIPETLKAMETDDIFKESADNLKKLGQKHLTRDQKKKLKRSLDRLGIADIKHFLKQNDVNHLNRRKIEALQLNVGLYCNQACNHCHVESSPKRTELMSSSIISRCLYLLKQTPTVHTVDITGGAPELNLGFRQIVTGVRNIGLDYKIICRSNLTSLLEPKQEDMPSFLAENNVEIVASLPCYSAKNVNLQRGKGVFEKSITGLLILNELGYGVEGSGLILNLVYNPLGAFLPPDQNQLHEKYKTELWKEFGITFNNLFALSNMPIKRFADFLYRRGELDGYMDLLIRNFNINTLDNIMCRNILSIDYNGDIFDCDFNQQLSLNIVDKTSKSINVFDIDNLNALEGNQINLDNHCYGCMAGKGSS